MVDSGDKMEPGNKLEMLHRRDRRKKSLSVSASIGGVNRLRFSLAIKFAAIGEQNRQVCRPALHTRNITFLTFSAFCFRSTGNSAAAN